MSNALVPIKAADSGSELIQMVSFMLADEEYGVEVLKVREIIRMPTITKIPNTPHYIEGIINLRGKVIPIMSMRKRFDQMENENNNLLIIMNVDWMFSDDERGSFGEIQ
jgi:purine-binding chemotaxis protein CheW